MPWFGATMRAIWSDGIALLLRRGPCDGNFISYHAICDIRCGAATSKGRGSGSGSSAMQDFAMCRELR